MEKQSKKRWFEMLALDSAFWLTMDNIGWLVAEFFLYGTTRLIVRLFSFGRLVIEGFYDNQPGFSRFGLKREAGGRLLMSADAAKIVALCFWALCLAAIGFTVRGFGA
ncbi:hypothetical protein JVX98_10395 [Ensifer sp. PDNC004]|uniref:hypothetical protein n=1 Tax=unclassified Ensifer TaxID=2633371 RepID=UPI00177D66F1|nr:MULTISPECIES: hypothetical protein [unclassified Ensifer]MBD9647491.1 hypothetical protein [Ensifer sp. ENS09]QRY68654.1 hypothetical protein JVX98_10395 [Ensifer sp. PDNC004]